jgi:hypothetical protein
MYKLNVYTVSDIISYCDIDTKLIIRNVNKLLCNDVGTLKLICDDDYLYIDKSLYLPQFIIGVINNSWRFLNDAIKNNVNDWDLGAMCACQYGCVDMLKFFMKKGIHDYKEIMYSACYYGHYEIVETLMTEPSAYGERNYGFSVACGAGHLEIAKLLFDEESDLLWAFENACCGPNINTVNYLIDKGVKGINSVDIWNRGLFLGCQNGQSKIIRLMIEKGANYCMNCKLSMEEHSKK